MSIPLRAVRSTDWPEILAAANRALPGFEAENEEWVEFRQAHASTGRRRIEYVLAGQDEHLAAYIALEEGPQDCEFRLFVVGAWQELCADCPPHGTLGDALLETLLAEPAAQQARLLWVRETASDPVLELFLRHGFQEIKRFLMENEVDAVVLVLPASS